MMRGARLAGVPSIATIILACGGGVAARSSPATSGNPEAPSAAEAGDDGRAQPNGPPKDVDCGDFTTCAIAADDRVHCWGRDKEGELGDGAGTGSRAKRVLLPGLGKVRKVALASQFGCAILEDKKVKCWGTGRIANDGRMLEDARPTLVRGVEDVEELVAGGVMTCARNAGGITCWGADDKAIGTPPKGTFKQIAVGFTHACALDAAGAVTCWGSPDWAPGGVYAKPGVSGALQVVTGDRHACVLTKSKTVQCWGMNDAGQLGMKPDVNPHPKPVAVSNVSRVAKLAAGEASTCALLEDGSVCCWGANGEGELGLGTRSSAEGPARVSALSEIQEICLASAHGCALTKNGQLLFWGSNAFGQVGDGTRERRPAPTPVVW
jgi:alpha-tubulin suppressor-like RCC1 family protein